MPTSVPEENTPEEAISRGKKLTTYPINLQSFLQTLGLLVTLIGVAVYTERRITTLEVSARFQSETSKEMRDDLKRSIANQEQMLRQIEEARRLAAEAAARQPSRRRQ
jgi:hypothetical protein